MNGRPQILFVDHNERNVALLTSFLRESGYPATGMSAIGQLDELLADEERLSNIALGFIDVTAFEASIWDCCRRMQEVSVPFVILARAQSAAAEYDLHRQSRGMGARHTLTKPLRKEQLLTLVRILTGTDD